MSANFNESSIPLLCPSPSRIISFSLQIGVEKKFGWPNFGGAEAPQPPRAATALCMYQAVWLGFPAIVL